MAAKQTATKSMIRIDADNLHCPEGSDWRNVLRVQADGTAYIDCITPTHGTPADVYCGRTAEYGLGYHYDAERLRAYLEKTWESEWFPRFWSAKNDPHEDGYAVTDDFKTALEHHAGYTWIATPDAWAESVVEYPPKGGLPAVEDVDRFVADAILEYPEFHFEGAPEDFAAALRAAIERNQTA